MSEAARSRDGIFEPVHVLDDRRDLQQLAISSSGVITYATSEGEFRTFRVDSTLTAVRSSFFVTTNGSARQKLI